MSSCSVVRPRLEVWLPCYLTAADCRNCDLWPLWQQVSCSDSPEWRVCVFAWMCVSWTSLLTGGGGMIYLSLIWFCALIGPCSSPILRTCWTGMVAAAGTPRLRLPLATAARPTCTPSRESWLVNITHTLPDTIDCRWKMDLVDSLCFSFITLSIGLLSFWSQKQPYLDMRREC